MAPPRERLLASLASELGLPPQSADADVLAAALRATKRAKKMAGAASSSSVRSGDAAEDPERDFVAAQLSDASVAAARRRDEALRRWRARARAARDLASGAASLRVEVVVAGDESGEGAADEGEEEGAEAVSPFPADPHALAALGAASSSSAPRSALSALTSPLSAVAFERRFRGRRAVWVRRPRDRARFASLFSLEALWAAAARDGGLRFGTEVDVARTVDGRRETINGPDLATLVGNEEGKKNERSAAAAGDDGGKIVETKDEAASPLSPSSSPSLLPAPIAPYESLLSAYCSHGCSLRVLHPQRWSAAVWRVLAALEDEAGSLVGCNAYATPPGSQGFAPHWDDVDVFVLQIAGRKRWRIKAPKEPAHVLPRRSSRDLAERDMGEDVAECLLEPGDLLYLPRGVVHYAVAEDANDTNEEAAQRAAQGTTQGAKTKKNGHDGHGRVHAHVDAHVHAPPSPSSSGLCARALAGSLHLTISMDQSSTLADVLERAAEYAVAEVAGEDAGLRAAPPVELADAAGTAALAARAAVGAPADPRALALWRAARAALEAARGADALVPALARAADDRARAFVRTRLPPPHLNGAARPPPAASLSLTSRLAAPGRDRAHLEVRGDRLALFHCLRNDRRAHAHRQGDDEDEDAVEHGHGKAQGEEEEEEERPLSLDEPDLELAPCLVFPTVALLFPDRLPPEEDGEEGDDDDTEKKKKKKKNEAERVCDAAVSVPTLSAVLARWWGEAPEDWEAAGQEAVAEGLARTVQDGAELALLDLASTLEDEGLLWRVHNPTRAAKARARPKDEEEEEAPVKVRAAGAMKGSILKRTATTPPTDKAKKTKKNKKNNKKTQ